MHAPVPHEGEESGEDLLIRLPGGRCVPAPLSPTTSARQFARSGGPGGQNVNKVATKALLRRDPRSSGLAADVLALLRLRAGPWLTQDGEILISSQRDRNRRMNIADCVDKLRGLLLAAVQRPEASP